MWFSNYEEKQPNKNAPNDKLHNSKFQVEEIELYDTGRFFKK